jgi:hypothetical protein
MSRYIMNTEVERTPVLILWQHASLQPPSRPNLISGSQLQRPSSPPHTSLRLVARLRMKSLRTQPERCLHYHTFSLHCALQWTPTRFGATIQTCGLISFRALHSFQQAYRSSSPSASTWKASCPRLYLNGRYNYTSRGALHIRLCRLRMPSKSKRRASSSGKASSLNVSCDSRTMRSRS